MQAIAPATFTPDRAATVGHTICAPCRSSPLRASEVSSRRQTGAGVVSDTSLTLRVDFGPGRSIGPGKIRLLEAIDRTGSISQAGRTLGMSYRRAWLLIDDMNQCFRDAVVSTQSGGAQGGGAELTPFGQELIATYRAIESQALAAGRAPAGGAVA